MSPECVLYYRSLTATASRVRTLSQGTPTHTISRQPPVASTTTTEGSTTTTGASTTTAIAPTTSGSATPAAGPPATTTTTSAPCVTTTATETTSAVLHLPSTGSDTSEQSTIVFPLPGSGSTSSDASNNTATSSAGVAVITPVWRATAGSDVLAAWFVTAVSPSVSCTTDATLRQLVCRLPRTALPASNFTTTAAAAATLEATVQASPCPSPALRLVLSLVRPVPSADASATATVVLTTALVGTTAYTLVVEPWAVEPLVLAGVLDGPCAPPAVQDTARIAVFALNPFAALEPALAGGMLVALVVLVVVCNAGLAVIAKPRAQLDFEESKVYDTVAKTSSIVGRALFPRVAFAVALAALPGVAWAAAAAIRGDPSGPAIVGVVVCAAYVVAVPCVGALVVMRLAPARFVHRRIAPSESVLRRMLWPSGRWTTDGFTAVTAAMNVRGLTGGPRGGELLFVGSSLLATAVFAITVAPPASGSCAARHYAASALFSVAAVVVACLRPHRAPITTGLTTLILLLAGASTAAVGAVAGDPTAPYAPAAGLATAAMVLSIVRSVHAVVMARVAIAADKKNSGSYSDENHHHSHQEMALAVTEDAEEGTLHL